MKCVVIKANIMNNLHSNPLKPGFQTTAKKVVKPYHFTRASWDCGVKQTTVWKLAGLFFTAGGLSGNAEDRRGVRQGPERVEAFPGTREVG